MAIVKVEVSVNGAWTPLALTNGKWTGAITAPATTSYNLEGKYYPVQVRVTNSAGTVKIFDTTAATIGESLKLFVKETVKPVITVVSPSKGAYVTNNKQKIVFNVTDEVGGSGVNKDSVTLKLGTASYTASSTGMVVTAITNGFKFEYTPQVALKDGVQTITINAKDNDENAAETVNSTFKVDTVPPTLTISSPKDGLITNKAALTVSGKTNDVTSSPVKVNIKLNNVDQGTVTVGTDGAFSKSVNLKEGANTIVVTATDSAGKKSSITLEVTLDTTVPVVKSVVMTPNPVNTNAAVQITIEVG